MASARAATAAAVAGLAAVAAWFAVASPSGGLRAAVRANEPVAPASSTLDWQDRAIGADRVPESARHSASAIEIAVIDTGADVAAPDLAARQPLAYDTRTRSTTVTDLNGHGTFVASLAAAAGGDARLLVVKAAGVDGGFTT